MSFWRKYAAEGAWHKIKLDDYARLSAEDRYELIEVLRKIVPTRVRGDGLETFEDYIWPDEYFAASADRSVEGFFALLLLRGLLRTEEVRLRAVWNLLGPAVELAQTTIMTELSLRGYEGLLNTYLWQQADGSFRQVCSAFGNALHDYLASRASTDTQLETPAQRQRSYTLYPDIWITSRPVRRIKSLVEFWRGHQFEPNSTLDHALSILEAELRLKAALSALGYPEGTDALGACIHVDPWIVADFAFSIGRHYEALKKKPVEALAITKVKEDAKRREHCASARHEERAKERKAELTRQAKEDGGFMFRHGSNRSVMFIPDRQAVARAMKLADAYDDGCERAGQRKQFRHKGEKLRKEWFQRWWEEFKHEQTISLLV